MDLGSNIRARRAKLGITLETLAKRTGVSRAMLSEIERDAKNPTIKVVCQIAEGLGCTVSQLLGEAEEPTHVMQVGRYGDRQILVDAHSGVERHLLSPAFQRRGIEVLWYLIPPVKARERSHRTKPGSRSTSRSSKVASTVVWVIRRSR